MTWILGFFKRKGEPRTFQLHSLDPRTAAIYERLLDLVEGRQQKLLDDMAAKLNASVGPLDQSRVDLQQAVDAYKPK